jgi:hypothetical protein
MSLRLQALIAISVVVAALANSSTGKWPRRAYGAQGPSAGLPRSAAPCDHLIATREAPEPEDASELGPQDGLAGSPCAHRRRESNIESQRLRVRRRSPTHSSASMPS